MKYNIQKKAVSAVVATVLIIMITVAAVGIIWAAIVPMIQDSLTAGTICNSAASDISIGVVGYTCIDENGNVSLQIKKGNDATIDLVAVNAQIYKGGESSSVRINETNTGNVSGNLPGNNGESIITISGYADATGVSIAPIVKVGNTEKLCSATRQVALTKCTR